MAIQVAYTLDNAEQREVRSLMTLAEKTEGVKRLIIVTNEEDRIINKKGWTIEVVPIHKFLLGN